jgi:hypothetical protein
MRMEGRVATQSHNAAKYHIEQGHVYAAFGGFEEGNIVYKIPGWMIPSTMYDDDDINARLPGIEIVGKLFKVGGKWTIEQKCPDHRWNYNASRGNNRAKSCTRCGCIEFVDATLQAAFAAEYPEAA